MVAASHFAEEISVPVLIIGGGPVGMTLAMSLSALGTPCLIANTEVSPRWHPKGSTQNARTMEIYRRLGVSKALRGLGLAPNYAGDRFLKPHPPSCSYLPPCHSNIT
jgi:2-polyprenyl-6-methoxyphenol hydroxylase-like FAD-dependent oxidoreductase